MQNRLAENCADRPPTRAEAAAWLKRHEDDPSYCRACLRLWKASMGQSEVKVVFEQAPESVRKWIKERA